MFKNQKVLALIPARGGSKGLPGKNTRNLCGKPMIAYSIEAAQACSAIDEVVVSSEDPAIQKVAKAFGASVPFTRPSELATDEAQASDVILHALTQLPGFEIIVLLQPTSPLRSFKDIDLGLQLYLASNEAPVVSVTESSKAPEWIFRVDENGVMSSVLEASEGRINRRRQDLSKSYLLNGALYISKVSEFKKDKTFLTPSTRALVMPKERSIDIDDAFDFKFAEVLLEK